MMMYGGMLTGSLVLSLLLLGFAYIIWVLADKENGPRKSFGQVVAVVIAVLAVALLLYKGIYGGMMGGKCCKSSGYGRKSMMMYKKNMTNWPEKKMCDYLDKMTETPAGKKWMQQKMMMEK